MVMFSGGNDGASLGGPGSEKMRAVVVDQLEKAPAMSKESALSFRAAILAGVQAWGGCALSFTLHRGEDLFEAFLRGTGLKQSAALKRAFEAGMVNGYTNALQMFDSLERQEQGLDANGPREYPPEVEAFIKGLVEKAGGTFTPPAKPITSETPAEKLREAMGVQAGDLNASMPPMERAEAEDLYRILKGGRVTTSNAAKDFAAVCGPTMYRKACECLKMRDTPQAFRVWMSATATVYGAALETVATMIDALGFKLPEDEAQR